jgi:galactoside O-acetyltransferase
MSLDDWFDRIEFMQEFRNELFGDRSKLKYIGNNVRIYPLAKLVKPENIRVDDNSQIDDYAFIVGGDGGVNIGKYVHIPTHTSIIGNGGATLEDHATLTAGARLITSSADLDGYHGASTAPKEQKRQRPGHIYIERDGFISTNAVVMPGVRVGEGAVLGAGAVATKDLEPWTVYVGQPAKPIKERKRVPKEWY